MPAGTMYRYVHFVLPVRPLVVVLVTSFEYPRVSAVAVATWTSQ